MSQHYYETTYLQEPVLVIMGWDRPLQGFFLLIEKLDRTSAQPDYLYSNLDDPDLPDPHPKVLNSFLEILRELSIYVPQSMLQNILVDQAQNIGSKIAYY